jgi:hypothetical protein
LAAVAQLALWVDCLEEMGYSPFSQTVENDSFLGISPDHNYVIDIVVKTLI